MFRGARGGCVALAASLLALGAGCSEPSLPLSASCSPTDNTLIFSCGATMSEPAAATWTVREGDKVVHQFATEAGNAKLRIWGLAPRTRYGFSVDAAGETAEGNFETGALPAELDDLQLEVTGRSSLDAILFSETGRTSRYLLVAGTDGRILWYHPLGGEPKLLIGYSLTEEGHVVAVSGESTVEEVTLEGETVLKVDDFERPVHHDVSRGGDYVYVLNASVHDDFVIDGFYVIDRAGKVVKTFDLADHVTISGPPGADNYWPHRFGRAKDWSHANSIWSDGKIAILSLRWQDTAIAVRADPNDPRFGERVWTLTGTDLSTAFQSDYTWTDGGQFHRQHEVFPMKGGLSIMDTESKGIISRAVELVVDDDARTVHQARAWGLGQHCEFEGSSFPLANGGMLTGCAAKHVVHEYAAGSDEPIWTLTSRANGNTVPRAIPIQLP